MHAIPATLVSGLQLSLRAAVAAASAVAIAHFLRLESPIYAVIAAVLVLDLSPSTTIQLSLQRMTGTLLGATVGGLLSYVLPAGPVAMGISILVAMLLCSVLQLRGAAKVSGYVCGIVVLVHGSDPWTHAVDRAIETLLGIGMAVLVSLVPKLMRVEPGDDVEQE